ncbi:MAG: sulfur carrier protein ThiS [Candidatus Omnitrophica bacterium]|nr:sulfur carrier protein ThiS [Candidatus Omnitrophota bacterium]
MGIKIQLNGKKEDVPENMHISELLENKKIKPEVVVVELNGRIIERPQYSQVTLKEDDTVELVFYMGGGTLFSKQT